MATSIRIVTIKVKIKGVAPLLHHNGIFADPTNEWNKKLKDISGKRKKTDADYVAIKKIEFMGGLYYREGLGVYIPDTWLEKSIRDGAADFKKGKNVLSGVQVVNQCNKLIFDGPQTPDELFEDPNFVDTRGVVIQRARIMRTRPKFENWECEFVLNITETVISPGDVQKALEISGMLKGLGDYRPKFGRFEVVSFKE
jgi:hypothetical protein